MAATQQEVTDYINYIRQELAFYGNKHATRLQQGHKPSFDKTVKLALLQSFVDIAEFYLDEYDDPDNNFITVDEFEDIMKHINRIANSFHWLEIE